MGRIGSHDYELTDGVIGLRPLAFEDAERHLAGEDEEQVRWLNEGYWSTPETVRRHIERMQEARRQGIALWNFGAWEVATGDLVGNIEANGLPGRLVGVGPGEANISYVIFPDWRRQGYAFPSVNLICRFLKDKGFGRAIIRVHPDNEASAKVARRAGFHPEHMLENIHGPLRRYARDLDRDAKDAQRQM